MKKKLLIFGFGSIGVRHANLLFKIGKISSVLFFSKRKNVSFKTTTSIKEITAFNPDYILVCSETHKHFQHLRLIEKKFKNKIVLVEKPLFHKLML